MWVAEYRQVLKSWALVEGTLADKYDLSLRDIVTMSWRRFVVIYRYLFTSGALTHAKSNDDAQLPKATDLLEGGRAYDDVDWNKMANKSPADHVRKVTLSEFMDGSGLPKKVVE